MNAIHHRIDFWLERLKWPIAVAAVFWTPLLVCAWVLLLRRVLQQPYSSIWFGLGVVLFFMAWKMVLKYRSLWRWLMRAEHEATHLLFAALTGHPIVGWPSPQSIVDSSERSSQEAPELFDQDSLSAKSTKKPMQFVGDGNWLIQIAPYFFPTAAGILWFIALFIPLGFLGWTTIALGFATGFHVTSTVLELRTDRAELAALDWRFCWMFLPAANLLLLGCLLTFSQEGFSGIAHFVRDTWRPISYFTSFNA